MSGLPGRRPTGLDNERGVNRAGRASFDGHAAVVEQTGRRLLRAALCAGGVDAYAPELVAVLAAAAR